MVRVRFAFCDTSDHTGVVVAVMLKRMSPNGPNESPGMLMFMTEENGNPLPSGGLKVYSAPALLFTLLEKVTFSFGQPVQVRNVLTFMRVELFVATMKFVVLAVIPNVGGFGGLTTRLSVVYFTRKAVPVMLALPATTMP